MHRTRDGARSDRGLQRGNGPPLDALCFAEYDSSRNLEDFAREAARPAHPRVVDVTRKELVEVVRRILDMSPDGDYYMRLLEVNVLHPAVSDMIFWPSDELHNAPAERIVDEALKYRPIAL
ncbi:hypothetical protein [Streptomyces sp. ISL-10]|uniref:hypothetical protein n=1 Tax=Streptomyces sp. ISL-10 TaxID=2819172 RepID=UPI0020354A9F|nr:hypothetical protein [Streptomyces sp. ISL-10]